MHDRSDYKHGWEIERDYEAGKLKEAKDDEYLIKSEDDGEKDDELPFNCFICRESFKVDVIMHFACDSHYDFLQSPVVTKCKHYFCEQCALNHYRKSKKCAACGANTEGVFNTAKGESLSKNNNKLFNT